MAGILVHDVPREATRLLGEVRMRFPYVGSGFQQRRVLKTMLNERLQEIGHKSHGTLPE